MKLVKFCSTDGNIIVNPRCIQAIGSDPNSPDTTMLYMECELSFEVSGSSAEIQKLWEEGLFWKEGSLS